MPDDHSRDGKLQLTLVTHDRPLLDLTCDEIYLPGTRGVIGILPGHVPLLATLKVGELRYVKGKEEHSLALSWGFCEVSDDTVTVLAEFAELPQEIDLAEAEQDAAAAQSDLMAAADVEWREAHQRLSRALTRIEVARKHHRPNV